MSLKTLELELTDGLAPIALDGASGARILVRYHGRMVGWVRVDATRRAGGVDVDATGARVLGLDRLRAELLEQVGHDLVPFVLGRMRAHAHPLPPISVVICTRDREASLERCLASFAAVDYPEFEVIVVDNASRTDAAASLADRFGARCVREERPGLDWARNRGIAEARHGIVAFTDDDVEVDRLWLRALGQAFADPATMAVTGMVAPAELETPAQIEFEEFYGGMGHGLHRRTLRRPMLHDTEWIRASAHGCGANMAFRRSVLDELGRFDVALDAGTPSGGAGDLDMIHRVIASGHTLVYEPDALVRHYHRRTDAALRRQIFDNGRGFGCYLITCARNRTVTKSSLLRFVLVDWLLSGLVRRIVRRRGLSRRLVLAELRGALLSPMYYISSRRQARRITSRHGGDAVRGDHSGTAPEWLEARQPATQAVTHPNAEDPTERGAGMSELMTRYGLGWPPGHFYSPVPSPDVLRSHGERIFAPPPRVLPGLDLNEAGQIALLEAIAPFYSEAPWGDERREGLRYHYDNPNFRDGESIVLFGFLRHLRPRRFIEIGCGFSSAALLDVNERWFDHATRCTFIEPYPDLLVSLLRPGDRDHAKFVVDRDHAGTAADRDRAEFVADRDRIEVLARSVQDVETARFQALEAGDILFLDSTHVTKLDSDVNHILFRILPVLNEGVCVHFHDVYYPFEYPREWAEQGRGWNEAYILRAFLQFNDAFEVIFFNDFLGRFHRERLKERLPRVGRRPGSSLWLRKRSPPSPVS